MEWRATRLVLAKVCTDRHILKIKHFPLVFFFFFSFKFTTFSGGWKTAPSIHIQITKPNYATGTGCTRVHLLTLQTLDWSSRCIIPSHFCFTSCLGVGSAGQPALACFPRQREDPCLTCAKRTPSHWAAGPPSSLGTFHISVSLLYFSLRLKKHCMYLYVLACHVCVCTTFSQCLRRLQTAWDWSY